MIRLEGINKYFNRYKKNQIHVINNTTLTLEGAGLVALLGPSGCGKTTLLNVIGGLDTVNGGQIYLDDERITKRATFKKDAIRNLKVGYIFQNYNLIDNMTVFDNIALVLKMQGMKDEKEIKDKVHYALEMVGMYRYRNRFADMLSGGERQRVGIARAIVKNPQIIIADEPTGNLDSKNTLDVMNIIKTIAEKKLVILVTHEERLANFYASRIIRLEDGKIISDEINEHGNDLDYRIDNDIYLKDLPNHKVIEENGYKLNIYDAGDSNITLNIVIKNGNIYLQTDDYLSRLEIVDENSTVDLIDAHYEGIGQDEYLKQGFDMSKLEPNKPPKHSSILNSFSMIKAGFTKVMNYSILKKLLLFGFCISAMFIVYGVSSIAGALNVPDERFITANKDYLIIKDKTLDVDEYLQLESNPDVQYLIPGNGQANFKINYTDFLQTSISNDSISGSLTDSAALTEKDIKAGSLPTTPYEIVLDELVLKKALKNGSAKEAGFFKASEFIGREIKMHNLPNFKIVGITDKHAPNIYMDRAQFINVLSQTTEQEDGGAMPGDEHTGGNDIVSTAIAESKGEISWKSGKWPENPYEVSVNYNKREAYPLNKEIPTKINGVKLKTVGYFTDPYDRDIKVVSPETMKYNVIKKASDIIVMPKGGTAAEKKANLSNLKDQGYNIYSLYDKSRADYDRQNKDNVKTAVIMGCVILIISLIEIYLIIRASFLSRIKEIGVYRAIGVKRLDIYRMFLGEIFAITSMAAIPGFAFMTYIVIQLTKIQQLEGTLYMSPIVGLIALGIIYAGNIIFGLMPVWSVLRKTPAAILSRTDVD